MGTILAFVNVSFADPGNFLASLSLDSEGNLIVPKIKAGSIVLDGRLSKLDEKVVEAESTSSANLAEATSSAVLAHLPVFDPEVQTRRGEAEATTSSHLEGVAELNLTPPDILIATGSATLANLKITDTLSSDKLVIASDSQISGDLKVFGKTTLANTTIAGDLTVDGTLSFENGSEINVIGLPDNTSEVCQGGTQLTSEVGCQGILYLQRSSLAQGLNIFNGLVTIDKLGNLRAQAITVAEFRVVAGKISGSGKIEAGKKDIEIENPLVKPSSRILITPTSETNLVLAVTDKKEGEKFIVSSPQITDKDITFDFFLIGESL